MKVRVYSDLHLDSYVSNGSHILWYPPELPNDLETILILAGDIWIGTNFIQYANDSWLENVAKRFKQLLIVLGNHDYWPSNRNLTIQSGAKKCNDLIKELGIKNATVLDRDIYIDGDILFVGCTLWTDMNNANPLAMYNMSHFMRYDGKITFDTDEHGWVRFTSEKWIQTHYKHRDYLKIICEQNRDKKIVVITHHMPLIQLCDPNYVGDISNCYYYSDLSNLILDNPHIKMWVYGHTHHQQEVMFEETLMINNCVGYASQNFELSGLVKHKVIEI